jgi:hypothetical protein
VTAPAKKTTAQWRAHIESLEPGALFQEATHANTAAFVRTLNESGYTAAEIHACLLLFAQRFQQLGHVPPRGGYVDLQWLANNPGQ